MLDFCSGASIWFSLPLSPPAVVPVLAPLLPLLGSVLAGLGMALLGWLIAIFKPAALKNTAKLIWRQKLVLGGLIAVVALAVWGATCLWPRPEKQAVSITDCGKAGDWSMARGGLLRLGAVPGDPGPVRGRLNWSAYKDKAFFSSPAISGDRLYISPGVYTQFSDVGTIACLEAKTGKIIWENAPPGYRCTFSSPVICGKYLVSGEGLHWIKNARVVCLDKDSGEVQWTFRTKSHVECTPVVSGGRVYVGAGDDGYYCLKLEPAVKGQAEMLWHAPGEQYLDAETSLAVHDGKVYAGLGGKALCVLDAATGKELQRLPMPYQVFSPPAIAGGKLYFGMGNGDFIKSGKGGEVRCLDLATLRTEWSFQPEQTVLGAIAVAGEQIFFGSQDGHLYCLDLKGKLLGKWNSLSPLATSPAVAGKQVYVMTAGGELCGLDRESLRPVWKFRVGTEGMFFSAPVVADGRAYVGSEKYGFICAGEKGEGERPWWPGPLGRPGRAGNLDESPLPEAGAMHWNYPGTLEGKTAEAHLQAPIAAWGENLYVPLALGSPPGVACLPHQARETPKQKWFYATARGVARSPALYDDRLFIVDGRPGEADRRLHCVNARDGKLHWQTPVAPEASGHFCVTTQHVFVQSGGKRLACYDLDGRQVWAAEAGALTHPPSPAASILVVSLSGPDALAALDAPTGRELWRVPLPAPATGAPATDGLDIFLPTTEGVEARLLKNGSRRAGWKLEGGGASSDVHLGRASITYINTKGEVVQLERADGAVRLRLPGALPGTTPMASRDRLLFAAPDGLKVLSLADQRKPLLWADVSWLGDGRPTAPLVMHDSNLYTGFPGWGLVRLGKSQ